MRSCYLSGRFHIQSRLAQVRSEMFLLKIGDCKRVVRVVIVIVDAASDTNH